MKCPNCGAEANGRFCEYCGSRVEDPNVKTVHIVNNYYGDARPRRDESDGAQQGRAFYAQAATAPADDFSDKSRVVALILCLLLGVFGAHHFYCGRVGIGILYLLTLGLFGIGWFVDLILIAAGEYKDGKGLKVRRMS